MAAQAHPQRGRRGDRHPHPHEEVQSVAGVRQRDRLLIVHAARVTHGQSYVERGPDLRAENASAPEVAISGARAFGGGCDEAGLLRAPGYSGSGGCVKGSSPSAAAVASAR